VWIDASEWKWRGATAPTKRELSPVSVLKLIPITLLYEDVVYTSIAAEYKEARLNDMIQIADVKIFLSVHGSGICPSHIIQFSECCAGKFPFANYTLSLERIEDTGMSLDRSRFNL
jgi:hypothetical protein